MKSPSFIDSLGLLFCLLIFAMGVMMAWAIFLNDDFWIFSLLMSGLFFWASFNGFKNMFQWLEAYPERKFQLKDDGILIEGEFVSLDDVQTLGWRYEVTKKKLNFSPSGEDHTLMGVVETKCGQNFKVRGGQGPFTFFGPSYGKKTAQSLKEKLLKIDELTLRSRLERLLDELNREGHFKYDNKTFDKAGNVYFDGTPVPLTRFGILQNNPFVLRFRSNQSSIAKFKEYMIGTNHLEIDMEKDRTPFLLFASEILKIKFPVMSSS